MSRSENGLPVGSDAHLACCSWCFEQRTICLLRLGNQFLVYPVFNGEFKPDIYDKISLWDECGSWLSFRIEIAQ